MKITQRKKDGKEIQPLVELRRQDADEVREERARSLDAQLRQAQEAEALRAARAAEVSTLKARRWELRVELESAQPAATSARLLLAQARASGEGDLDALRAKVTGCKREIEELEAAIDIVDASLARLERGVQHGKFKSL